MPDEPMTGGVADGTNGYSVEVVFIPGDREMCFVGTFHHRGGSKSNWVWAMKEVVAEVFKDRCAAQRTHLWVVGSESYVVSWHRKDTFWQSDIALSGLAGFRQP